MIYHIPALLRESIDGLNIKPDGIYVDVTFGGGGHENTSDRKPRAADVYLDSKKPEELQIGNEILRKLLANAATLRVKYVTWNNRTYYPNGSSSPLSDSTSARFWAS